MSDATGVSGEDSLADWRGSDDAASWAADGSHEDMGNGERPAEWHAVVDAAWRQMLSRPGWAPVA